MKKICEEIYIFFMVIIDLREKDDGSNTVFIAFT